MHRNSITLQYCGVQYSVSQQLVGIVHIPRLHSDMALNNNLNSLR
jgi:hypothetical protein